MNNVVPMTQDGAQDEPQGFDAFWLLYPRKVSRKDARRAWDRIRPDDQMEALKALVHWRRVWLRRGELEFIPHAATWLNGERWTDELPHDITSAAAHQPAAPAKPYTKGEMPPEVRAAIAKLTRRAPA